MGDTLGEDIFTMTTQISPIYFSVGDSDSDGIPDEIDNCTSDYNPEQDNSDNDSYGDACDNCPYLDNEDQADIDSDGLGDVCDADDDNDGVLDVTDLEPSNPDICEDVDSDGCDDCSVGTDDFGPLTDNDPNNDGTDTDADGICDNGDNCPNHDNEDQLNSDNDSHGDACDNCPYHDNEDQADSDGDNIGDVCDVGYEYLPGDVNMSAGTWPPAATGPDVTYLVNYFRSAPTSHSCLLDGFWCSADANGDCNIIGSDVTKLVNVFRGQGSILYCIDYEPAWPTPADLPVEAPSGWPNCEE